MPFDALAGLPALIVYLAPALLVAAGIAAHAGKGPRPHNALRIAHRATLAALATALLVPFVLGVAGPATSPTLGLAGFGLSARIDALSATLFLLVAFVGTVVVRFSRSYLDGDPRQGPFTGDLCLTLAAVMLLVTAGNLGQLVVAWVATSLALHRLLVFRGERARAVLAARKKFLTARVGDLCLLAAAVILATAFGTGDIAAILAAAAALEATPAAVTAAALLIAMAALMKSAQFPAHGWLPEVMETPTPVSALLHAGIINAGGFLVIRFADVMVAASGSLHLLAVVGGFTALFGAAVMLTQTSIKGSLAFSTVSQMGFMMLQCGFGLFALAILHIVAHSLYKAHAFLSSGSVVEIARASWVPDRAPPRPWSVAASLGFALVLYLAIGSLFGLWSGTPPQVVALGTILIMGLTLLMAQASAGRPTASVLARGGAAAVGVTVVYFTLHAAATRLYAPVVPPAPGADGFAFLVMGLAIASFAAVTVLHIVEPARTASPFWRRVRVHVANGLYVNALFDRLVGAHVRPASSK